MILLDPQHVDVADLLSLMRDMSDRLDQISDRLDLMDAGIDLIAEKVGAYGDDAAKTSGPGNTTEAG